MSASPPMLNYLPLAALGASIIAAVLMLMDFSLFKRTWRYAKTDFTALLLSFSLTLLAGVEVGLISGVVASVLLLLARTSRTHIAMVRHYQADQALTRTATQMPL